MIQLANPWSRHNRDRIINPLRAALDHLTTKSRVLMAKLKLAKQISRERHTLRCLNEYQLRDIGLTREQVETELGRGIFDIAASRYNHVGLLQGGLTDTRRSRIARMPKD